MSPLKYTVSFSLDQLADEELTFEQIKEHKHTHLIVSMEPITKLNRHRVGRFLITNNYYKNDSLHKVAHILSGLVIVEAMQRFVENGIEYTAIHEGFDIVEEGFETPIYRVAIDEKNAVKFERMIF